MKTFILAASIALAAMTSTSTAGTGTKSDAGDHQRFTCYVGALGGVGIHSAAIKDTDSKLDMSANGVTGSLVSGCDLNIGAIIFGGWADLTFGKSDAKVIMGTDVVTASIDRKASIGGRLGYAIRPDTTIFGMLGYAVARQEVDAGGGAFSWDTHLKGLVVGAGIETDIMRGIRFRFDGQRYMFDSKTVPGGTTRFEATSTEFRAGVAFRF